MIKKIKAWYERRKANKVFKDRFNAGMPPPVIYSQEQLENAYKLGYNDGRRDGLAIARQQATNSLKEILSWQNKNDK